MANRTTDAAVRLIIEAQVTISTAPFIETANALVTELCAPVASYDAARLELIERWLSAHFYAVRDNRKASEKAGKVGKSNQHKVGLILQVTIYGQQAIMLDTNGELAALSKRMEKGNMGTVGATWLGKDYDDTDDE